MAKPRQAIAGLLVHPKGIVNDGELIWHCVNSRFTFEGAVDLASCAAYCGPRLLLDTDELSLTVAPQGAKDASILSIGEMIVLLDGDGRASKVSAATRRKVPNNARIACIFGCQEGRAQNYVAAWDPVNVPARFFDPTCITSRCPAYNVQAVAC